MKQGLGSTARQGTAISIGALSARIVARLEAVAPREVADSGTSDAEAVGDQELRDAGLDQAADLGLMNDKRLGNRTVTLMLPVGTSPVADEGHMAPSCEGTAHASTFARRDATTSCLMAIRADGTLKGAVPPALPIEAGRASRGLVE